MNKVPNNNLINSLIQERSKVFIKKGPRIKHAVEYTSSIFDALSTGSIESSRATLDNLKKDENDLQQLSRHSRPSELYNYRSVTIDKPK